MDNLVPIPGVSISVVDEPVGLPNDARWVPQDDETSSAVSALAHAVPGLATTAALAKSYRVEFPKGISGVLTRHGKGYISAIHPVGDSRWNGTATFIPMSQTAVVSACFNALSVITAQHYLSEINQQLSDIRAKLDQVLAFLYTDKACALYAETRSIGFIFDNYVSIMDSSEHRAASLATVQRAKIVAEQNIQFYYRDMHRMADAQQIRNPDTIRNDLENYIIALRLYGVCSVLEVALSQNFDGTYLEAVRNDCCNHIETHNILLAKLDGKLSKAGKPGGFPIQLPGGDRERLSFDCLLNELRSAQTQKEMLKEYERILADMEEEVTKPAEFMIDGQGRAYRKQA